MELFGITERNLVRGGVLVSLMASGLALSGCMSSPTYGTDKTANEQLAEDLSNAFTFAPTRKQKIEYKPRPALVKPAPGQKETLPVPQDSITQTASAEWPESPEQRRARIRADATAHRDDANYQPLLNDDVNVDTDERRRSLRTAATTKSSPFDGRNVNDKAQRAEINRRLAENKQGDAANRKYLSEPPLTYRAAADTAPVGDIGEDELKKERRLKKEAQAGGKKSFRDWLPW